MNYGTRTTTTISSNEECATVVYEGVNNQGDFKEFAPPVSRPGEVDWTIESISWDHKASQATVVWLRRHGRQDLRD